MIWGQGAEGSAGDPGKAETGVLSIKRGKVEDDGINSACSNWGPRSTCFPLCCARRGWCTRFSGVRWLLVSAAFFLLDKRLHLSFLSLHQTQAPGFLTSQTASRFLQFSHCHMSISSEPIKKIKFHLQDQRRSDEAPGRL